MICLLWGWAMLSGRTREVRNSVLPPELPQPGNKGGWEHADFFGITQISLPRRDIGVIASTELLAACFAAVMSSLKCLFALVPGQSVHPGDI